MSRKKKAEIETGLRSAQPEEVAEWSQRLAGLIEERVSIKRKQKEAARNYKQMLEANEEEQERLSRMIITQQEEVPVKRQMTLEEMEDRRRHEMSLEQFKRESEEGKSKGEQASPEIASTPQPGVCRVCGCSDDRPCYGADDESCVWARGENQTLCTICQAQAASPEAASDPGPMAETGGTSLITLATVDDLILQFEKRRAIPTIEIYHGHSSYNFVMEATTRKLIKEHENVSGDGYEIRLTNAGKAELKKLVEAQKKKRKPKSASASVPEPIVESSDDGEADPLDLVPDDKQKRNWSSLSDRELGEWNARLSRMVKTAAHDHEVDAESEARLKRVIAVMEGRDAAWLKADAAGGD
jgi:hypothetical protein